MHMPTHGQKPQYKGKLHVPTSLSNMQLHVSNTKLFMFKVHRCCIAHADTNKSKLNTNRFKEALKRSRKSVILTVTCYEISITNPCFVLVIQVSFYQPELKESRQNIVNVFIIFCGSVGTESLQTCCPALICW